MKKQTPTLRQIIVAGESLAIKVKQALYPNEKWNPKLAFEIGYRMRDLKKIARPFYPNEDEVRFIHILAAYSEQDIRDALDFKLSDTEVTVCNESQPNAIGKLMERYMETESHPNNQTQTKPRHEL